MFNLVLTLSSWAADPPCEAAWERMCSEFMRIAQTDGSQEKLLRENDREPIHGVSVSKIQHKIYNLLHTTYTFFNFVKSIRFRMLFLLIESPNNLDSECDNMQSDEFRAYSGELDAAGNTVSLKTEEWHCWPTDWTVFWALPHVRV